MINDILISLKDNIQKRSTNPILGTFTIVYIIHNWELFYSVLFFDSSLNLEQRLQYIRNYYHYHNFWENFFICIVISLLMVLLTYASLAIGRYISSFYSSKIEMRIFEITDNKKIVLKTEYDNLMKTKNIFMENYENERKEKTDIINERDLQYRKYLDMIASKNENETISNLTAEVESIRIQLSAKNTEIESLKKQSQDKDQLINKLNVELSEQESADNTRKDSKMSAALLDDLNRKHLLALFQKAAFDSNSGKHYWGTPTSEFDYFFQNNILKIVRNKTSNEYKFELTKQGTEIYDLLLKKKLVDKNIK